MRSMIVAAVLLAVLTGAGCGGKKKQSVFDTAGKCPTPTGGRYSKLVVVHAKEKANGAPIKGGKITLHAEMSCPMSMRLINKNMQETSPGTYKAGYSLIMPGQWAFYFVLRDKNGDATTSAFPLTIKAPGS